MSCFLLCAFLFLLLMLQATTSSAAPYPPKSFQVPHALKPIPPQASQSSTTPRLFVRENTCSNSSTTAMHTTKNEPQPITFPSQGPVNNSKQLKPQHGYDHLTNPRTISSRTGHPANDRRMAIPTLSEWGGNDRAESSSAEAKHFIHVTFSSTATKSSLSDGECCKDTCCEAHG